MQLCNHLLGWLWHLGQTLENGSDGGMLHLPPVPWRRSGISVRQASLHNTVVWADLWEKHTPLFLLICFTSTLLSLSHSPRWNGVWLLFLRVFFTEWTLFSRSPPQVSQVVLGRGSERLLCKWFFFTGRASWHLLCTRDVFKGKRIWKEFTWYSIK